MKLNTRIGTIAGIRTDTWDNLPAGTAIDPRGILFAKIDLEPPKTKGNTAGGGGGNKKKAQKKAANGPPSDPFSGLQLVVGRIDKIWLVYPCQWLFFLAALCRGND